MKLTSDEHQHLARRAWWYFECAISPRLNPRDSVMFTGQGVDDLDRIIGFAAFNPGLQITAEVGGPDTVSLGTAFPKYLFCDIEDLVEVRAWFVAFYGAVDRPNVYGLLL